MRGSSHRAGLYGCSKCRGQFTVTVGTPLAGSKLPLRTWVQAAHLLNSHKPITVREVEKALGVTYKTAWQMVQKLLKASESYRGPLPKFGATVSEYISQRQGRPQLSTRKERLAAWKRKKAEERAGTYNEPLVPVATGALSALKFTPPPSKAHLARTERFLRWTLETQAAQ